MKQNDEQEARSVVPYIDEDLESCRLSQSDISAVVCLTKKRTSELVLLQLSLHTLCISSVERERRRTTDSSPDGVAGLGGEKVSGKNVCVSVHSCY